MASDYHDGMLPPLQALYEPEGAREVVQAMHDDLDRKRRELADAVARRDRVAASRVAHGLKSEVRIVAADALGHALEAVERELRSGDFDTSLRVLAPLVDRCETLFRRLVEVAGR